MSTHENQGPAVRASVPHDTVAQARLLLGPAFDAIQDPPFLDALDQLSTAGRLEWFGVEPWDTIAAGIHARAGDDAYRLIVGRVVESVVGGEVFRGLLTTFRMLFGLSPTALLRAYPSGFSVLYRDFGTMRLELDETARSGSLVIAGAPPRHLRPTTVVGFQGSLEGLLRAGGGTGRVDVAAVDVEGGSVRYRLAW